MIGIVGQGHIGKYLHIKIPNSILFARQMKDIVEYDLRGYSAIVNTAGKTDLSWCEANKEEARRINVDETLSLARKVFAAESRFIQLSSGCVWDGPFREDGEAFEPDDTPSPACWYAETKVMCDAALMALKSPKMAILRLRMPYSPVTSGRNLLTKLCGYEKLIDDPNSVTSVDTLLRTIESLIRRPDLPLWGRISCIYDSGITSPFRIGSMLAKAGLRTPPGLFEKSELDIFHFPKRVNTVLYDGLFEHTVRPPDVEKELARIIVQYRSNREEKQ